MVRERAARPGGGDARILRTTFGFCLAAVLLVSAPVFGESHSAGDDELVMREVLQEAPLSDDSEMKVIISKLTLKPGGRIPLHTHAGDEHGVMIKGGSVEMPDGTAMEFADGATVFFSAGDVHGGVTNTGDADIEIISTHVVRITEPFSSPAE